VAGLALVFGGSLGFGAVRGCDTNRNVLSQFNPNANKNLFVAQIEDRKIKWVDYYLELDKQNRQQDLQTSGLRPPEYQASVNFSVLRRMLDMEYFDIRAQQEGITVTDQEIQTEIDVIRSQLVPPRTLETERSLLQRAVDAFGSVKQEEAFELALQQRLGVSLPRLHELKRQEILARKYVNQLLEEAQKDILDGKSLVAADIRTEIENGREFGDAAGEYSNHEDSKENGGLIPRLKRGDTSLPSLIVDTALALPIGEVSQPLQVGNPAESMGVWLVTVLSRKEASGEQWEAEKEILRSTMLEEKRRKAEAGEIEMPADGNLTVSDDEVKSAYEEATIRVIFLKGDDPMQRVSDNVQADVDTYNIQIFDPELRATYHISRQEWEPALAAYYEALDKVKAKYEPENPDTMIEVNLGEARIRYLIGNLWSTIASGLEQDFYTKAYQQFMANPDVFGGEFPTLPEETKVKQEGIFVSALLNLNKVVEFDDQDPWSRLQRSSIDVARQQITPQVIDDLAMLHEYFQADLTLEDQILGNINRAISYDDTALETAGGVRPETWVEPVLPEQQMGLTLDELESHYTLVDTTQPPSAEETGAAEPESDTDTGAEEAPGETTTQLTESEEPQLPEEQPVESAETQPLTTEPEPGLGETTAPETEQPAAETEEKPEKTFEETLAGLYIPELTAPEATGPLTQELRDRLNALLDQVQAAVDLLERQKAEAEAQQEADLQQQAAGLNPNQPTEIPLVQTPPAETPPVENPPAENPPSEGADNLLNGENGDGE
jgi:hypothetical protein